MALAPDDILNQRFRIVFRGYDVDQVDAFLDRFHAELLDQTTGPAQEEESPLPAAAGHDALPAAAGHDALPAAAGHDALPAAEQPAAEQPGEGGPGHAARALRTLLRAEQMADQVLADAAAEAEQIRLQAQADGEQLLADARAERARVDAELQLRRDREIGALALRCQQLQAEADRLADLERRCREGLQTLLTEHQRLLEQRPPIADGVRRTDERAVSSNGHVPVH